VHASGGICAAGIVALSAFAADVAARWTIVSLDLVSMEWASVKLA
jgi:hypothetical protein